jgi:hypothetical protein
MKEAHWELSKQHLPTFVRALQDMRMNGADVKCIQHSKRVF